MISRMHISKTFLNLMEILSSRRFDGAAAEPRKGIRSGHVPGSKCIPFAQVRDQIVVRCLLYGDDLKNHTLLTQLLH
jgi:3-mercaptopyruvate sulfurtransferase SseA